MVALGRRAVRPALATVLCGLGGLAALVSLFGVWAHVTPGPAAGPGAALGAGGLVVSLACFCGWYWFGT